MLEHLDQFDPAVRIRQALHAVVDEGRARTVDMGGTATTAEFTKALVAALW
jgi:isocitrate/isopropylmalate dehydrogenase